MRDRGEGRILITGSIAGFTPGTYQAVYNATKAFIDSFSFALHHEVKDQRLTVACLIPGATETEFFERADMVDTKVGTSKKDDPADIAKTGLEAMMPGDGDVVSGWIRAAAEPKISCSAPVRGPGTADGARPRRRAPDGGVLGHAEHALDAAGHPADDAAHGSADHAPDRPGCPVAGGRALRGAARDALSFGGERHSQNGEHRGGHEMKLHHANSCRVD